MLLAILHGYYSSLIIRNLQYVLNFIFLVFNKCIDVHVRIEYIEYLLLGPFDNKFIYFISVGYYCTSGVDRPKPGASNDTSTANCTCPDQAFFTGVGGVCPVGHYCPQGSPSPVPCASGTYADTEGLSVCWTCPQGYYCLANSTGFLPSPCPVGEYRLFPLIMNHQ